MVNAPPLAADEHAESMYQFTVPVELDEAVSAWPPPPAFTGLPDASCSCTVMTALAPGQTPAVKVRDGVVKASLLALPATTVSNCADGFVSEDGLARLIDG